MLAGYHFQFRLVLTICTVLALGVLMSLGTWQLHRLEWKRDIIAKVEMRVNAEPIPFEEAARRAEAGEDMEYTPVRLVGRWRTVEASSVFGSLEGRAGAFIFAPLFGAESDGRAVYVNVGYVPQAMARWPAPAPLFLTPGSVEVSGLFRSPEVLHPPASWFRSAEQSVDGLWFVRNPALFAQNAQFDTARYYIDQFAVAGREWPKGGTTRLDFNNRHLEYALTWFGLAMTLVGVWFAFSLQKW